MFVPEYGRRDGFRWNHGVLEACKRFRQGDVIEGASLSFTANADHPITIPAQDATEGVSGLVGTRVALPFAMVTSQTCDLAGERGDKYPLLQIAPVYDITGHTENGLEGLIPKNKVGEFIYLDGPRFKADGQLWVADLRFESAIEKGVLIDKHPIQGFADEDGYLRASKKIADARLRLAVDDDIEKHVLKPLRKLFAKNMIDHRPIVDILLKARPTTVGARVMWLYVVAEDDADVVALQGALDQWQVDVTSTLPQTLTIMGIVVRKASEFTWKHAHGTAPIDFAWLSDGPEEADCDTPPGTQPGEP